MAKEQEKVHDLRKKCIILGYYVTPKLNEVSRELLEFAKGQGKDKKE